jgi:hypothetical protein
MSQPPLLRREAPVNQLNAANGKNQAGAGEIYPPPLMKAPVNTAQLAKFDRLSVDAVKTLSETQHIHPEALSSAAWIVLSEQLNYRLRQLAHLASKFAQRHGRGCRLAIDDVNHALEHFGYAVKYFDFFF